MKTIALAGALLAATVLAGSASAATNLISNGGFNNGGTVGEPGGGFQTLGVGSGALTDWSIDAGTIDWIKGYWQSSDGDGYSVDLNGNSPATISQTISTVAGKSYTLTFDMSGNPDNFRGDTRIAVLGANGNMIGGAFYNLTGANSKANMLWAARTFSFIADGASTTISFASGNGGDNCCYGAAIDNVGVTGVPEPAAWALMILGFGAAGATLRRRRAAVA
jgi:choice-of-anchor C domain-containing protein